MNSIFGWVELDLKIGVGLGKVVRRLVRHDCADATSDCVVQL